MTGMKKHIKDQGFLISVETGVTILIVEQKIREVLNICNRVFSIKLGKVAFEGFPMELKTDKAKLKELFYRTTIQNI